MSFALQQQIKNNSSDIRNYIDDLYKWEDEVSSKKKKTNKSTASLNKDLPPVRGQAFIEEKTQAKESSIKMDSKSKEQANQNLKRDGNTVSDYYKAWDKFDVDSELKKLEGEEDKANNPEKTQPKINSSNEILNTNKQLAPAHSRIVIKGGRNTAHELDSLKEKANLHYRNFEFSKALELYSECLDKLENNGNKDPLVYSTLLSNRAMTLIKLQDYVKAEQDCDVAIKINPNFSKSYARKGLCHKKMGKFKTSLENFRKALEFDKENQDYQKEILILEEIINERRVKAAKNLVLPCKVSEKKMRKIEIVDLFVDSNNEMKKEIISQESPLNMTFTIENKKEKENIKINEKSINNENLSNDNKEENVKTTQQIKINNSIGNSKETFQNNSNLDNNIPASYDYIKLKEIDRVYKSKPSQSDKDLEIISKKRVKFRGDTTLSPKTLKKNVFDPKRVPQKPSIKIKKKISNSSDSHKTTLENVIAQGKQELIKNILSEATRNTKETITMNSSQFVSHWKNLAKEHKIAMNFLKTIDPKTLPLIFKDNLDVEVLMEIVAVFKEEMNGNEELIKEYMRNFIKTKRFEIGVSFLLKNEKKLLKDILEKVGFSEEELKSLFEKYKVD